MLGSCAPSTAYSGLKLARVHKKEEKLTTIHYIYHLVIAISTLALYVYAFNNLSILSVAIISFIFFIVVALMITAVQVGIFVDGKPFIGIGRLYKSMPLIAGVIAILTILIWIG